MVFLLTVNTIKPMTCSLHTKLDAAVVAAKAAFDEAHENGSLSDSDTNLCFVYYQGLKKIKDALPEHKDHIEISLPDDYNVNLYNNDPLSGDISFNLDGPTTVTTPEGSDNITFTTAAMDDIIVTSRESDEYDTPKITLG